MRRLSAAACMPLNSDELQALTEAEFPFDEEIDDAENRAVNVEMLHKVVNFAENRMPDWSSDANLACLMERVIAPATSSSGRAFAEHSGRARKVFFGGREGSEPQGLESINLQSLAGSQDDDAGSGVMPTMPRRPSSDQPGKPKRKWCVSCSLGMRVTDLLSAIQAHAWVRNLPEDSPLWILPLALTQEEKNQPVDPIIEKSLDFAEGLVVLLDEPGALKEPTCLSFITACLQQGKSLDIVANGVVLADGLTESEAFEEVQKYAGAGLRTKTEREKNFPVEVLKAGLNAELKGCDEKIVAKFRSMLAGSAWMTAVEAAPDFLGRMAEVIAADDTRDTLRICLAFCDKVYNDTAKTISKAMGPQLRSLFMDLSGCEKLADDGMREIAAGLPPGLRSLTIHCWRCEKLTNSTLAAVANSMPAELELLELNFTGCRKVSEDGIEFLVSKLPPTMRSLRLVMAYAEISNPGLITIAAKLPASLQELNLDFAECRQIGDKGMKGLVSALPPGLVVLKLSVRGCDRIGDRSVTALAKGLPSGLTSVSFQVKDTNVSPEKAKICSDLRAMRGLATSGPCCELQ